MDIDVIMSWPLDKIYGYMAFYMTESEKFKIQQKEESVTVEDKHNTFLKILGV